MSYMETFKSDHYPDGRTKQAYKDSCDIHKILANAATGQTLSHLAKHGATYGDFSDIGDLMDAHAKLAKGLAIFQELPGEIRSEFNNDARAFFEFVNNPKYTDQLARVLPQLAAPGQQMPEVRRTADGQRIREQNAVPPSAEPAAPPAEPVE